MTTSPPPEPPVDVAAVRRAAYREGHTNGHATGHALGFAKGISKQSGTSVLPPASPPDSPLRTSAAARAQQVPSTLAVFAASLAPSPPIHDGDENYRQESQQRNVLEKQVLQLQSAREATQQARRTLLEQTFAVSLLSAESPVRGAQAAALLGAYQTEMDALTARANFVESAFSQLLNDLCAAAGVQPLVGTPPDASSSSQAQLVPSHPSHTFDAHQPSWPPLLSDLLKGDGAAGLQELKDDLMSPERRKSAGPEEGDHRAATHELLAAAMEAIQLTQAALQPTNEYGHRKSKNHEDEDDEGDDDFDATLNLSEISDPSRQSLHQLLQHQTKERGQRPTSKQHHHHRGSSRHRPKGSSSSGHLHGGGDARESTVDEEGDDSILSANSSVHSLRDTGKALHGPQRSHKKRASKHSRGRGDERGERTASRDDGSPMLEAPLLVVKLWAAKVRVSQQRTADLRT